MKGLLFTYLMTAGGSMVSFLSPYHGFLCYVLFAIIKPEAMWPWAVPPGRYSMAIALSMLVGWSYTKKATFQFGGSWSVIAILLAFWGWAIFGAILAPNQGLAWDFVEATFKIVLPVFIGLTTIDSTAKIRQLAWTIICAQGYVALEMNLSYFSGFNTLALNGFGALDNNSAAIALVTGLGSAFFLGMQSEKLWQKGLAFALAGLMAHAVQFSMSRGGMLAMMISGATAFLVIPKRPRHYVGFALAGVLALASAGEEVRARFFTAFEKKEGKREESAQSRLDLWRDCWDVMKKNPVMGCGPNHWPVVAPNYGWPFGKEAHSLWMQTGAELGFPGLAMLASFYLVCMLKCWRLVWRRTIVADPWIKIGAQMSLAGLTGFMVSAQFVSLEALEIPYYTALLGAAALKIHSLNELKQKSEQFDRETYSAVGPQMQFA